MNKSARRKRSLGALSYQNLEPRQLLAGLPIVTEFLASNSDGIVDDNGDTSDWIEIYNAGDASVNLAGYTLTDNADDPDRWTFPSISLAVGQFLVVRAATDAAPTQGNELYTGFGLSADGEYVGLYDPTGAVLSEFGSGGADYPTQYTDVSYGVEFDGSFNQASYFSTPTPGAANTNPYDGVAERVQASVAAGFYEDSFQVSLSTDTPGAFIGYTTDGSTPTPANATLYSGPITISSTTNLRAVSIRPGYLSAPDRTWSYLYIDEILTSQANSDPEAAPAGGEWTSNWGSHVVDYNLDPTVINQEGVAAVKDALLSIPSWSITTDYDNLFDPNTGIYANPRESGELWERPASVELLNPDGSEGFQVNAGLRIRGGYSRSDDNPKHSFRLFFSGEYGDSELNYPVHGDTGTDTFKKLDLRTAQNYSWSKDGNPANNFIIDRFSRLNQGITDQPYTRSSWLHLYINGQYWGLYETQERAEANFAASYLGGDADDYDVIKTDSGRDGTRDNIATDGTLDAYDDFRQLTFSSSLASNADYMRLQGLNADGTRNTNYEVYLDVDNLIGYMTEILYSGNRDAPISNFFGNEELNNYYAIRDRTANSTGFKFFVHDAEHSYQVLNQDRTGPYTHPNLEELDGFNPQTLHQELMVNEEYRTRFMDFIQKNFFNDGPFTVENLQDRWDAEVDRISSAIIAESARWGDAHSSQTDEPLLKSDWVNAVNNVRNSFLEDRQDIFLNQLRNTSPALFPDVEAPSFQVDGVNQNGGEISAGALLSLAGAEGTIYYTVDGTDPRAVGGGVSSGAIAYDTGVTSTEIFDLGSDWKHFNQYTSLDGTNWKSSSYNDNNSQWPSGPGELGYGDGDEATVVSSVEDNNGIRNPTTYFRKTFSVAAGSYISATLRVKRDDGVAVYLNGVEIGRNNLDAGATFSTYASSNGDGIVTFNFAPGLLLPGSNTLAVEIHQRSDDSSDISFDASLTVTESTSTSGPFTLNSSTNVQARVLSNGEWSAVNNATFALPDSQSDLRISELHFNPADPTASEIAAGFVDKDDFEFIEIYNPNSIGTINLDGMQLSNGVTFSFGNENLAPGERAVVVEDADAFSERYGTDIRVLGEWSGALNNGGEKIELVDGDLNEIMSVDYGDNDPWYNAADGHGFSLVLDQPSSTPQAELGKYYSWRASTELGGTPGAASSQPLGVVINEVLAHTDAPQSDTIELFNPTASSIDISGWFLSDEGDDLLKYQIPDGTVLAAGGYVVFDEQDFNPNPANPGANDFALNGSDGDQVYLSEATFGIFLGLQDSVEFDATFNGDSLGRLPNGTGRLTRLADNSFGSANGAAAVSPLVISEINYHPEDPTSAALAIDPLLTDSDLEFIEIANPTGAAIDLTNWRLRGEVDYDFGVGTTIAAGGNITVLSFDPNDSLNTNKASAFEAHYGISLTANFVGGFDGSLSNNTGRVALQQPDTPDMAVVPRVVVDEVVYDDLSPWADADGSGDSLNRVSAVVNGNFASSWSADAPTPGVSNLVASAPQVTSAIRDGGSISRPDLWTTFAVQFSADVDVNVAALSLVNASTGGTSVDLSGITMNYIASTSTATWDLSNLSTSLPAAFYSVTLNSNLISGSGGGGLLDGNGNGSSGGSYTTEIYQAIPGDANLDGQVNVLGDGFALVRKLGTNGGSVWADGDFNADGNVSVLGDGFVLVGNLGDNVIPPASSLASQLFSQPVVLAQLTQSSVLFEVSSLENYPAEDHKRQTIPVGPVSPTLAGSQSLDDTFASDDWLI